MTARSADGDEKGAAAAMRRLVDAHHGGRLSGAVYRERRRQLLETITRGDPVPQPVLPSADKPAGLRVWWLAGAVLALLFALGWWLSG